MEAHEDIWDDSALINSWNEALTEYKVSSTQTPKPEAGRETDCSRSQKYHSIHATGGKLEDLAECVCRPDDPDLMFPALSQMPLADPSLQTCQA